jgi:tetratricopeptide (TPR) repeat protein
MRRVLGIVLLSAAVACGGGSKKGAATTPNGGAAGGGAGGSNATSMADNADPGGGTPSSGGGTNSGGNVTAPGMLQDGTGSGAGGEAEKPEPPIVFPNLDPDPAQARAQVDAQLTIAKNALSQPTPDADAAMRAAREALKIDASNVEAAAYVAFAYYHKKQYDTAELVLDDMFKRPKAKQNPTVYYVYGLVYEKTNRPEQAVLAYKKAVELNPNYTSALVNLGAFQLRNKQYGEAQQTFEKLTRELGRQDAVTLTSLGSAYRGRSGDYAPGSRERNQLIMASEAAYKRATAANPNYGPAYFNLSMLYLDADPFPSGGGSLDTLQRLNAAKSWLNQYKNMPGVDIKLYDERTKDIDKAIKREEKKRAKAAPKKGG